MVKIKLMHKKYLDYCIIHRKFLYYLLSRLEKKKIINLKNGETNTCR